MTAEEIIRRWAEQRYGLQDLVHVDLIDEFDYGYSEMTPGMGAYVAVTCYVAGKKGRRKRCYSAMETDYIELIHDIAQFAANR